MTEIDKPLQSTQEEEIEDAQGPDADIESKRSFGLLGELSRSRDKLLDEVEFLEARQKAAADRARMIEETFERKQNTERLLRRIFISITIFFAAGIFYDTLMFLYSPSGLKPSNPILDLWELVQPLDSNSFFAIIATTLFGIAFAIVTNLKLVSRILSSRTPEQTKSASHPSSSEISDSNASVKFKNQHAKEILKEKLRMDSEDRSVLIGLEDKAKAQHICDDILNRLRVQPNEFQYRGNVALGIGLAFMIGGIGILLYFFLIEDPSNIYNNASQLGDHFYFAALIHYLPRAAVILTIEVIGLFFLKLYSKNHADAKYYQDEITSVELRIMMALMTTNNQDLQEEILSQVCSIDRNSVISSNQTTVGLERQKIANMEIESGTEKAARIFNLLKASEK